MQVEVMQKRPVADGHVVLCKLPHNSTTPYATWVMDRSGARYSGRYFYAGELQQAQNDFRQR